MGQYGMDLMNLSNNELLNEFEIKTRFKLTVKETSLKSMYERQLELIRAEIKRRMRMV